MRLVMNQSDMAKAAGVTKKTQGLYEKGVRFPDARYLATVAEVGVDVYYVLTGNRMVTAPPKPANELLNEVIAEIENIDDVIEVDVVPEDGAIPHLPSDFAKSLIDKIRVLAQADECDDLKKRLMFAKLAGNDSDVVAAKFVTVPLHDVQGSCGDGSVIHSEQIVDYLAFKREWISRVATDPKRLALIEAAGDSMMPTIHSGDLLLIDLCVTRVEQDAIYAINVEGMLYIKRIQKRLDGTVIVKSDNPAYEEQRFNASEAEALRIVGRVIWMGKRV